MITDLTKGNPAKILWSFSLPLLLSVAFQQLYSITDSVIVGRYVGENALAAVGTSYPITTLFIAVANGFGSGSGVVISRYFGSEKYAKVKTASYTSIVFSFLCSLVLTIVGLVFSSSMLVLLKTETAYFSDARTYLDIYFYGLVFLFFYSICNAVFTALGDSKTPLYLLIFSSVLNVALDLYFVLSLGMGVGGAAWATFIAQCLSGALALIILIFRLKGIECAQKCALFSLRELKVIGTLAVPGILQSSFISVGNMFIQAKVNSMGVVITAGYSAAVKLNTFAITCFTTVGNAVSSFTAQNMGKDRIDRVTKGLRCSVVMIIVLALPFMLMYTVFGRQMMGLFDKSGSTQIIDAGRKMLLIIVPFYFVPAIKIVCDGILRGSGAIFSFTVSTLIDFVLRVILCYILSVPLKETGIWLAWPVGWIISCAISVIFYKNGSWKRKGRFD